VVYYVSMCVLDEFDLHLSESIELAILSTRLHNLPWLVGLWRHNSMITR